MVAGVDYIEDFRVMLLVGMNCGPEDPFTTATGITVSSLASFVFKGRWEDKLWGRYQYGWKNPTIEVGFGRVLLGRVSRYASSVEVLSKSSRLSPF